MIWGGRWEEGSGLGTHVHPWWIHVNVWKNQYSMVKQNKVKIKVKKIIINKKIKSMILSFNWPFVRLERLHSINFYILS